MNLWLVVSTHLKNISQIGSFPKVRGENKKCLSCHHLGICICYGFFNVFPPHFPCKNPPGFASLKVKSMSAMRAATLRKALPKAWGNPASVGIPTWILEVILLMAEILNNYLGWCWNPINNGINYLPINWCRISAINSPSTQKSVNA